MSNEPAKADGVAKKKRNRKKKPKNNNSKDATPSKMEEPQKNGAVTMNPHAALRNSINVQGYSFEEIDQAMEVMWDKGMAYDEVDAVLKYLKTGGKEDKKEEATPAEESKATEGEAETSQESEPEAPKVVLAKQAPMSMVAKLDMVADFENLPDAVFALTEWVNKAAKPKDVSKTNRYTHSDGRYEF
jgi:hypothetical protein